jgi:hypothetical protein
MMISSRWLVMGLVALGASACSDPVPPPAQGAFTASVRSPSPPPDGKACPVTSTTFDVPQVDPTKIATDRLTEYQYPHNVVDGKDGTVSCSVKKSGSGFTFDGNIQVGSQSLSFRGGTVGADGKGTAVVTLQNGALSGGFAGALTSPSAGCTINASGNRLQVDAGHIWATFSCSAVEQAPAVSCAALGTFVLENCSK